MKQFYQKERKNVEEYVEFLDIKEAQKKARLAYDKLKRISLKRARLSKVISDLTKHIEFIEKKILSSESNKHIEEADLKKVVMDKKLHNSVFALEKELKLLSEKKLDILEHEKDIVGELTQLLKDRKGALSKLPKKYLKELAKSRADRFSKIDKQKDIVKEELELFLIDKNIFDKLGDVEKTRIFEINKKISELQNERIDLIRKRDLAIEDDKVLISDLKSVERKRLSLEKQLYGLITRYGGVDPKKFKKEINEYLRRVM